MGVISIDYQTLSLVAILLFAAVGFSRGWLKEGITTVLLILLVGLLYKPELVTPLITYLNKILKLVQIIIKDAGQFDLKGMAAAAGETPDIFSPENPYNFLLWLLIILIALSYIGTRIGLKDDGLTPLSRILGGLAGAINGFIALSLVKEYLLGYFDRMTTSPAAAAGASIQAGSAPAGGLSVAIQEVPQVPFVESAGPLIAIMAGVVILILILSSVFKWKLS